MKLGFDATALGASGKGIARFQREFLRAAAEHRLVAELTVFVPSPPPDGLPQLPGWTYLPVATRPMIVWEQVRRPALARRLGLDAVITQSERVALWGPPEVAYVYEHPKYRVARTSQAGKSSRQRLVDASTLALFRIATRRAAAMVAASESTARDIGSAVAVVYSGVSATFTPGEGERTHFLHLASDDPRDNSRVVIEAYAAFGDARPPLVIAGPLRNGRPGLEALARSLGVLDTIDWRGFQTDAELLALYRNAIAYVDPSLYEGFGLQAAEALACATPVIASNRTSLPEVVRDGGILLDPDDVDGFADAMRRVVGDPALAAELGRRALEQAQRFRWERAVREIVATAERVVASRAARTRG